MLLTLHQAEPNAIYGNKINQLIRLIERGYQVPAAYIYTADQVKSILAHVFQVNPLELERLENVLAYASQGIDDQRLRAALQASLKEQLPEQIWQENASYIVRSSGGLEDSQDHAHAGLFDSVAHCHNLEDLVEAMKQSIQSLFTPSAQSYYQKNRLEKQNFHFALLIQEQIKADWSGVAFSINPLTGADQEFVLELIQGEGEALVGGQVEPIRCRYLINQMCNLDPIPSFLSANLQDRIWQILDQLRQTFAYPIDIELCGKGQEIYLLQLRPISPPAIQVDQYRWTTTNFRDGGVSAQVATPLIWSLYRDTWSQALGNFVLDQGLWHEAKLPPLIKYHYGRIYWNLGLVKSCMAQVPGYQEVEFDDELGVPKHYSGTGDQQVLSFDKLGSFITLLVGFIRTDRSKQKKARPFLQSLRQRALHFNRLLLEYNRSWTKQELGQLWFDLINQAYRQTEESYFQRVFLNTVQFPILKKLLYRKLQPSQFFLLISDLANLSHRRLDRAIGDLSRVIAAIPGEKDKWLTQAPEDLCRAYLNRRLGASQPLLNQLVTDFGYHSLRELNLLVPSFSEDPLPLIQAIHNKLGQDPTAEPDLKPTHSLARSRLNSIEKYVLKHFRELLCLREEYKDLSTFYYHLVRQLALKVADFAVTAKDLDHVDDIFYLDHVSIQRYLNRENQDLRAEVDSAKAYVRSFANYSAPLELYPRTRPLTIAHTETEGLRGVGANQGCVQGRVRVIEHLEELNQIQANEILVTPFLDTGWVHIFSQLKGIITETGGILSHGAIMAREYQLPVIVSAKGVTRLLQTGDWIAMDGLTGSIQLIRKTEGV